MRDHTCHTSLRLPARWALNASCSPTSCPAARYLHRWNPPQVEPQAPILTQVTASRLNDDGPAAPRLLLGLRHALPCLLVGVICGTHRDFVLDAAQAVQVDVPMAVRQGARSQDEHLGDMVLGPVPPTPADKQASALTGAILTQKTQGDPGPGSRGDTPGPAPVPWTH